MSSTGVFFHFQIAWENGFDLESFLGFSLIFLIWIIVLGYLKT